MVKKIILISFFMLFLVSFASAEIIINQQPRETYNLGETIDLPVIVTSVNGIYDYLKISLICENHLQILPVEEISLAADEVVKITKSILLIEKFVGNSLGNCKIKAWLQDSPENYVISEEFKILNSLEVESKIEKTELNPGERVLIEGKATKENEQPVNGIVELNFMLGASENKSYQEIITDGFFSISFDLPKETGAGEYSLKLSVYEKDPLGEITNKGSDEVNIKVNQVPTSLEISFENQEVKPGTNLKVKTILHDQTGEKIDSTAIISIKDNNNKVLGVFEKSTDEFLEFPIAYNEFPAEWTVVVVSTKLSNEANFKIIEKQELKAEIINKTVIFTNIGNVPYNKQILVKIGNESLNINTSLKVDETKKYTLYAPDGKYLVDILTIEGESKITGNVVLTGNAVKIKEASNLILLSKYPFIWFFVIFVLGFFALMIFKKGYKRSFFGHINLKGKEKKPFFSSVKKELIKTKNKAELSLSLSGEKQKASIVCLKIKNFKEIKKNPDSVRETLEKIKIIVEENKVFVYENHENLFFILSPAVTKTFDNEKNALKVAQKFEKLLKDHNKLFRQRIDFGISLNSGEIISKKEGDILKFMGFGNLIINAKKIAAVSDSKVYLSEKMKENLMTYAKTEKHKKQGLDVYTIKEIKDKENHKKFISDFLKRLEKKDSKED